MDYEIKKNKIIIKRLSEFNTTHILECGQIFRYQKTNNLEYVVYSLDKKAKITNYIDRVEICSEDIKYFETFFDLNENYDQLKQNLQKFPIMDKATEFGYGIRILKQDIFEVIISFIISANNNIKRIQSIIEKICIVCGKNMGDYYAFPTIEQLLTKDEKFFKDCGLGYRASYIYKILRQLKNENFDEIKKLDDNNLKKWLIEKSGIGPKVADCIMLFGFGRKKVFPVDTWIEKVYHDYFEDGAKNRVQINNCLVSLFGELSGYAQQYLFYYKREM